MSARFIDDKQFPIVMRKIVKALKGYDWCMIGGRSVEVWSNPPQTPDVDVLIRFTAREMKTVIAAMERTGFTLVRKFFDPDYVPMLFFSDDAEHVEVDLIGAFEDVHEWALDRSVKKTVGGVSFRVAKPEDIVILKANAALSPTRGEKAERDKAAIEALANAVDLDGDYIDLVLSQALMDWTDERKLLVSLGVLE